jgi:hypothetical protein
VYRCLLRLTVTGLNNEIENVDQRLCRSKF